MQKILMNYYKNNAKKLRHMVDGMVSNFGGLSEKDRDDFYSLANEVFVDAMRRYDGKKSFDCFLYSCLSNRIKTEMTRRNRQKRRADLMTISMDMPVSGEGGTTVGDFLPDRFDVETEVFGECTEGYSKRMCCYLKRLSSLQRKVLVRIGDGYLPEEIREELKISKQQYSDCCAAIRSYRNVEVLL